MKLIKSLLSLTVLFFGLSASAQELQEETESAPLPFSQRNEYQVTARLQLRTYLNYLDRDPRMYTQQSLLEDPGSTPYWGTEARRLRIGVKGKADNFFYQIDIWGENLINTVQSDENSAITFAYIGYSVHKDYLNVRVGSDEIPFTREWITSSGKLVTMERAVYSDKISEPYGNGFFAESHLFHRKLGIETSITDSQGGFFSAERSPRSSHPLFAERIQWDPLGEYKNGSSYLTSNRRLSFAVATIFSAKSAGDAKPYYESLDDLAIGTFDGVALFAPFQLDSGIAYSAARRYHFWGYHFTPSMFLYKRYLQAWLRWEMFNNGDYKKLETLPSGLALLEPENVSETRYLSFGANLYYNAESNIKLQIAQVIGLNQTYNADTNQWQDLGHRDDWTAMQLQISF